VAQTASSGESRIPVEYLLLRMASCVIHAQAIVDGRPHCTYISLLYTQYGTLSTDLWASSAVWRSQDVLTVRSELALHSDIISWSHDEVEFSIWALRSSGPWDTALATMKRRYCYASSWSTRSRCTVCAADSNASASTVRTAAAIGG